MAMNVPDISSYQSSLTLTGINYDGVVIKATGGVSYVNPYCDVHFQEAKAQGKKRAVYHFYDFDADPVLQANFFVDNCQGYIHDAIFVLDWEGSGVADVDSAAAFLRQVEARIGYKPAIYMSQWVENTYAWGGVVTNDNGLWIARYSNWELNNHAHDWDLSNAGQAPTLTNWPFYFMWQWTSTGLLSGYAGDLDCNIAYLTPDQWDSYAGVIPPTTTTTTTEAPTTIATTTVAPAPDEPPSTTTSTTTVPPVDPAPAVSTTTTTTAPLGATTTEAPTSHQSATWFTLIWVLILNIIRRLQGK